MQHTGHDVIQWHVANKAELLVAATVSALTRAFEEPALSWATSPDRNTGPASGTVIGMLASLTTGSTADFVLVKGGSRG